ncbi:MAG: type IV pili twitching motility protein PilT, partial [Pseudomonadota bacterium]
LEAVITQTLLKRSDGTGRVAVHEILVGTPAVRNLIRENKIPQISSMMQVGSKSGMVTMKDSLYKKYNDGIISKESVRSLLASGGAELPDDIVGTATSGNSIKSSGGF